MLYSASGNFMPALKSGRFYEFLKVQPFHVDDFLH
jgi:hypothetical protein